MARRTMTAGRYQQETRSYGGASRAHRYLPPWLIWLGLPLVASVFWSLASFGTASAVMVGGLLTFGGLMLCGLTFREFSKRKDPRVRWDATITVGLAAAWVMVATAFGLFHNPHVDVWPHVWRIGELIVKAFTLPVWGSWAGGGILVAVAWNIRRAAITNPEGEDMKAEETPLERALNGAKLKAITAKPDDKGQILGRLEGERGRQTGDDLQKLAAGIESAMRLRDGAVRIAKDPKDRGAASVVITPNDPLEKSYGWAGPSLPGGNIADAPIPFSIGEDGEVAAIWFPGDEKTGRNLVHYIVEGANGSGKSMAWRTALADALTRTAGKGVRLHGVDVSGKWRQTFGPLVRYMTNFATEVKPAKKLIRDLSAYVKDKQERMGAAGFPQWSKDCGEPLEFFLLEEGSEIAADSQELVRAAERWRSAGVVLIIVIQRASWDNIDTTTRSQLGGVTAFGVNDSGQGSNCLSLPSAATDQGADPSRWGSRHPGRHYVITSTTPEDRMAIPHLSPKATDAELAAALEKHCTPIRNANGEPLMSPVEALAVLVEEGVVDADDATRETLAKARAAQQAADDSAEEDDGMVPLPPDPDPDLNVDPNQPIQPPDEAEDIPMHVPGVGGPKLSEKDFRTLIQTHLGNILAAGRSRTQAADVHRMRPETGYSRESVRKELVRLCSGPYTETDRFRLRRDEEDRLGVFEIYEHSLAGV
jgi:hypothetical protein